MLLGLPAHQAHGPLVVLAEEPQRFPVAAALARGHGALAPAPRPFGQPGQGPVGPQRGERRWLAALGAGERAAARPPAAVQAAATEVVAALDGHRVLEIVQADGAGQIFLQVLGFHDASLRRGRGRGGGRSRGEARARARPALRGRLVGESAAAPLGARDPGRARAGRAAALPHARAAGSEREREHGRRRISATRGRAEAVRAWPRGTTGRAPRLGPTIELRSSLPNA